MAMLAGGYLWYTRVHKPLSEKSFYKKQGIPFLGMHVPALGDMTLLTSMEQYSDKDPFNTMVKDLSKKGDLPKIFGAGFSNYAWLFVTDCDLYRQFVIDHGKDIDKGLSFDKTV